MLLFEFRYFRLRTLTDRLLNRSCVGGGENALPSIRNSSSTDSVTLRSGKTLKARSVRPGLTRSGSQNALCLAGRSLLHPRTRFLSAPNISVVCRMYGSSLEPASRPGTSGFNMPSRKDFIPEAELEPMASPNRMRADIYVLLSMAEEVAA